MENSLNEKPLNAPHNLLVDIREKNMKIRIILVTIAL